MERESSWGPRHPLQADVKGERVVIIGTGHQAALASEYLTYDSPHEVVAFSAESAFLSSVVYRGLPAVPLEELAEIYPPDQFRVFVAVSLTKLNRIRSRLYHVVKSAGFECVSIVSSRAYILPSAQIGDNAFIQENSAVQHSVRLGDNVFIGSGTCVGHNSVIDDHAFTGPDVTISGHCRIGSSVFLGAKCCISDEVSVAYDCMVGAGAVVLKDSKPGQVLVGVPARPTGRDSYTTYGVPAEAAC